MDRNTHFVYHLTSMELYTNPNIRILAIRRRLLTKWQNDNLKVSFWRLYWNSKPGANIIYNDKVFSLTPKRIVLVPPNTGISQRLIHGKPPQFFAHYFVDAPYDRLCSKIYVFKAGPGMLDMLKSLPVSENSVNDLGQTMAIRGLIHLLLARIPDAELKSTSISSRMTENMSFIEAHVQKPLSNNKIARHLGMSVNAMLRRYKREMDISPQAYLRQKRVEKACALLHDPQRSIKQIAEETGFCDRYHFSRAFKVLQGLTPFQYRKHFSSG